MTNYETQLSPGTLGTIARVLELNKAAQRAEIIEGGVLVLAYTEELDIFTISLVGDSEVTEINEYDGKRGDYRARAVADFETLAQ